MNLDDILIGVDVFTFISSCICVAVLYYDTKKLVKSTANEALQELAEQRLHYRKKFKV